MNKRSSRKEVIIIFICSLIILCLSACQESNQDEEKDNIRVIHVNTFVDDKGLIYDDNKVGQYKCYFDFDSMTNIYFCSKPNCDHTALECTARLCHPYTFFIGNDQYYIEKKYEMYDSKETFVSYLYKSDISNTEAKVIAKLDCDIYTDIYLVNNTLNIIAAKPKFVDGISNSAERWDLYQIDMKDYSVNKITLNSHDNIDTYMPEGVIDNNMIIYHKYYDKVVDPADYGLKGDPVDYIKDEVNYEKFMSAVVAAFHNETFNLNLDTGEKTQMDRPYPLLVYQDYYYYNRETPEGSHEMVSYNFNTGEEEIIFNSPVKTLSAIGDNLFLTEGIEKISEYTHEPMIGYKEDAKEFCYNLVTGELKEVSSRLPEKAKMELVKELGDYYIILYNDYSSNIELRVGYILKDDYFNDKSKYTLVAPE